MQQRFAIASHTPKNELLAAALRYRSPTFPNSDRIYSQTWNGNEEMAITTI
ncbi:MAG: hypothetical protein HEQ13_02725 [Dolichospermum sp. DEX189]|uniref:Uncharacterized protein n=1 Tax=Aphanizomenon flos-aquae FACHB-1040 TaxID=2692887 RepID=A0ABR8BZE0_APHFL|nr:hypothetical protein [Aphanizomenon flos-aquae]MBD2279991.1 hypothetical protein [Aphanizomenon flos-aquae FACHB-1040]MBO1068365.1 hypothetical protein [Dolichospermum sp. DEX189]